MYLTCIILSNSLNSTEKGLLLVPFIDEKPEVHID